MINGTRYRCGHCRAVTRYEDLARVPNPFHPDDDLLACPQCMGIVGQPLTAICNEPGCNREVLSGRVAADDIGARGWYRQKCIEHDPSQGERMMTKRTDAAPRWSDARALAVYRRLFPNDPVWPGEDQRASAIAEEMRSVKYAATVEAAAEAIEWWGEWPDDRSLLETVRRIRRAR